MFGSVYNLITGFGGIIGITGLGLGLSRLEKSGVVGFVDLGDSLLGLFLDCSNGNFFGGRAPPTMVVVIC